MRRLLGRLPGWAAVLYQVGHRRRLGMLWLMISTILGHWNESTAVSEWMVPQVTVGGREGASGW